MISTASDGSGALAESGSHPGKFLASSPSQMDLRASANGDGLPADVIRQIIEYSDNDSLRNLLLVDRHWNSVVCEYLERNIPGIKTIIIECLNHDRIHIWITIPKEYSIYYRRALCNFSKEVVRRSNEIKLSSWNPGQAMLLEAMTGMRVDTVHVYFLGNPEDVKPVEEIMSLWKYEKLDVHCDKLLEWGSDFIFTVLSKHGIEHLNIDLYICKVNCPRTMLLELSARLKTLSIIYRPAYNRDQPNYLFGLRNHDWVKLISEMFANKLHCLHIDNVREHLQSVEELLSILEIISSSGADKILRTSFPLFSNYLFSNNSPKVEGINVRAYHEGYKWDVEIRNPLKEKSSKVEPSVPD